MSCRDQKVTLIFLVYLQTKLIELQLLFANGAAIDSKRGSIVLCREWRQVSSSLSGRLAKVEWLCRLVSDTWVFIISVENKCQGVLFDLRARDRVQPLEVSRELPDHAGVGTLQGLIEGGDSAKLRRKVPGGPTAAYLIEEGTCEATQVNRAVLCVERAVGLQLGLQLSGLELSVDREPVVLAVDLVVPVYDYLATGCQQRACCHHENLHVWQHI